LPRVEQLHGLEPELGGELSSLTLMPGMPGILRKLDTLDTIYGKMADRAATRRMEVLEWIIIILIAVSITVSFLPGYSGH
jgi:hypothetical protein